MRLPTLFSLAVRRQFLRLTALFLLLDIPRLEGLGHGVHCGRRLAVGHGVVLSPGLNAQFEQREVRRPSL